MPEADQRDLAYREGEALALWPEQQVLGAAEREPPSLKPPAQPVQMTPTKPRSQQAGPTPERSEPQRHAQPEA